MKAVLADLDREIAALQARRVAVRDDLRDQEIELRDQLVADCVSDVRAALVRLRDRLADLTLTQLSPHDVVDLALDEVGYQIRLERDRRAS